MNHLVDITNDDKPKTFLVIPRTVPSNTETYKSFRKRERDRSSKIITRQNSVYLVLNEGNNLKNSIQKFTIFETSL